MDLRHYAATPVELEARAHEQSEGLKPSGLWLSVGAEWLDWCRSEEFRSETKWYEHLVTLADAANLLHLSTSSDLDAFTTEYGTPITPKLDTVYIDWVRVAAEYDGIVISPYQWTRRNELLWYYGWDVASGCIWNTDVVKLTTVRRIEFTGAAS